MILIDLEPSGMTRLLWPYLSISDVMRLRFSNKESIASLCIRMNRVKILCRNERGSLTK